MPTMFSSWRISGRRWRQREIVWQSPGVGIEVNQAESMVFCPGGGGCNPRVNLVRGDAVVLSQGGAEISLPFANDRLKLLGGMVLFVPKCLAGMWPRLCRM